MAKHCEHCQRDYPDHEPVCPHCHKPPAHVEDQAKDNDVFAQMWLEDRPPAVPEEDSVIHLEPGGPAPAEAAKDLDEWSAGEAPTEPGPDDIIAIEETAAPAAGEVLEVGPEDLVTEAENVAPSDVIDVEGSAEETPPQRGAQPTQLASQAPKPTMLASQVPAPTMLAPSGYAEEQKEKPAEAFPNLELSKAEAAKPPEPPAVEEVVLTPDEALEVTSPSGVLAEEVVEVPPAEEEALEVPPAAEEALEPAEASSALDLGEAEAVEEARPESNSAINLGDATPAGSSASSGVDRIAEALESGVDLAEAAPAAEEPAEEAVAIGGEKATAGESSAVDLGATAPMSDLSHEPDAAKEALEVSPEEALEEVSAKAEADAAEALLTERPAEVEAGEALVAEEPAEAEAAEGPAGVEVEEGEEELVGAGAAAGRKEGGYPKPKYGRRWLGGAFLGILLAASGAAAVWYFQPDLIRQVLTWSPNNKELVSARRRGPKGPTATPLQEALAALHEGKIDDAWAKLAPDTSNSPDVLSARGEVRWLKYLRDQKAKKEAPKRDAPEVQEALKELKTAAASNPSAQLLADQIQATFTKGQGDEKLAAQVKAVRALLLQANAALPDDPQIKDVPVAVRALVETRQQEAKRLIAIAQVLQKAKVVDDASKVNAATIETLVKDLGDARKKAAEAAKEVQALLTARKELDAKLSEVNTRLKEAKIKDVGAKGVAELVAGRDKLQAEVNNLNSALAKALTELNGSPPKAGGDLTKELMNGIAAIREKAKAPLVAALNQVVSSLGGLSAGAGAWMQKALDRAVLEGQLRYYQAREPLIRSPEQQLDTWIRFYQDRRPKGGPEEQQALRDARWITAKESGAAPEAQAKAHYLQGLIARNEGKYEEARKELQAALKQVQAFKKSAAWSVQVVRDLKELTDPTAYFLPRAEQFQSAGRLKEALATLDTGLAAIPGDGRMLALRSLVRVELSKSPAQLKAAEKQIRADAEAATKQPATAAAGWYALGRLEEELGHLSQAKQDYRQALKLHQGSPAEANRYRIALARILQRELAPPAESSSPAPAEDAAAGEEESEQAGSSPAVPFSPLAELAALAVIGQAPAADDEESPQTAARLKESITLANELIKSDDPKTRGQGYMLLGVAHSRMGQRTDGLKEYLKGLALVHPDLSTRELLKLVQEHPAFQIPDLSVRPSAVQAESHYGRGLTYYWSGQYAKAEDEFKKAVAFYGQDARYRYFLGLARLAQNTRRKREAAWFDFEQGARLEAEDHPGRVAVNSSLERIQGPLRQYLDRFREKGQVAPR
jgi:tetratricopeptide (TPR) repeat protein